MNATQAAALASQVRRLLPLMDRLAIRPARSPRGDWHVLVTWPDGPTARLDTLMDVTAALRRHVGAPHADHREG